MANVRYLMAAVVVVAVCLVTAFALRPKGLGPQTVEARKPIAGETISDVPRYRFRVGDAYVYEAASTKNNEGGTMTMIHSNRYDVWVVRQNDDGSFRLVMLHISNYRQERDGQDPYAGTERVTLSYCDMFPDGRYKQNSSMGYQVNPSTIFPQLPEADDLSTGWQSTSNSFAGDMAYELVGQPSDPLGQWIVHYTRTSPMDAIYESTASADFTFEGELGLVSSSTTHGTQGYGFKGESAGTITLVSAETVPDDWLATFLTESDRYFASAEVYRRLRQEANYDYGRTEELMSQAQAVLEQALGETTLPTLTEQLEKQLDDHRRYLNHTLGQARKFAKLIGLPSEEWTLDDLGGESHALADYRGQVVLLDFWYRGCGWCVRAMPQVKQVAEAFADRPVTVFGMNTDKVLDDARFVEQAMSLNYKNLQATGIPEKYAVTGFPTLVILDRQGKIADIHVGYADDLFEQVSASIERLLEEPSVSE